MAGTYRISAVPVLHTQGDFKGKLKGKVVLLGAMRTAMDEHFARAAQVELDAIEQLKGKGVTVADCDRAVFRDRVHPMWDRFVERTPGAKDMLAAIHQTETA